MATLINPHRSDLSEVETPETTPVYVWEWPVRIFHWTMVLSLIVLTVTGFYMHGPFLVATSSRAWVMGTVALHP